MKKIFFVNIMIILMSLTSCAQLYDMGGKGIEDSEVVFDVEDGEISCYDIVHEYFSEREIELLNRRVSSVKFVNKPNEIWFGITNWYQMKVNVDGNTNYVGFGSDDPDMYNYDIEINKAVFDEWYKNDPSDAKVYMMQATLIHELCHVLYSGPDASPADESVPSAVSRKGHNEEWYNKYKSKVIRFVENNEMQKYRIASALSKYGYEEFGSEYNYVYGARSAVSGHEFHCSCGGVHHVE
jgi:hypothetical protein